MKWRMIFSLRKMLEYLLNWYLIFPGFVMAGKSDGLVSIGALFGNVTLNDVVAHDGWVNRMVT